MRKLILYCFLLAALTFVVSVFLVSCKSAQPVAETTVLTDRYQKQIDSLKTLIINRAISDKMVLNIPQSKTGNKSTDSIVNAAISDILRKLNFQKTSGDNSFELLYDQFKNQLLVSVKVGETKSENTKVAKSEKTDKSSDKTKPIYIKKPYTKAEIAAFIIAGSTLFYGFVRGVLFVRGKLNVNS